MRHQVESRTRAQAHARTYTRALSHTRQVGWLLFAVPAFEVELSWVWQTGLHTVLDQGITKQSNQDKPLLPCYHLYPPSQSGLFYLIYRVLATSLVFSAVPSLVSACTFSCFSVLCSPSPWFFMEGILCQFESGLDAVWGLSQSSLHPSNTAIAALLPRCACLPPLLDSKHVQLSGHSTRISRNKWILGS